METGSNEDGREFGKSDTVSWSRATVFIFEFHVFGHDAEDIYTLNICIPEFKPLSAETKNATSFMITFGGKKKKEENTKQAKQEHGLVNWTKSTTWYQTEQTTKYQETEKLSSGHAH